MDVHYHYSCPLCHEEAIPERCPGFRLEWTIPVKEYVMESDMIRVRFKDGTYMDGTVEEMQHWEMQPDFDQFEPVYDEEEGDDNVRVENGKRQV